MRTEGLDLVFLSFRPPEPGDFGRVVRDARGRVQRIVEARNASAKEKIDRGGQRRRLLLRAGRARPGLSGMRKNPVGGEYYLTDAVELLARGRGKVEAIAAEDWREAWGVNTRRDLAAAEELERRRAVEKSARRRRDRARSRDRPHRSLACGSAPDVILHPFVSLEGATVLEEGCEIFPFTRLVDTVVSANATVGPHCESESSTIGPRARVGPFSRLRPKSVIEEDARIGNFVETKNTRIGKGAKAQHLAYLGDADVGAGSNIGAGVITCNYDGEKKHPTKIGERRLRRDRRAARGARDRRRRAPTSRPGTTVTQDVPDGALALSRVPQVNKPGWAAARKAKKSKSA